MSALALKLRTQRDRLGLKGPRAPEWLVAQGIVLPTAPNTWTHSEPSSAGDALLVARLGSAEFFLEEGMAGTTLERIAPSLDEHPPGVYPVLREDWAFDLGGERVHDVLAQVCNVNFAALSLDSNPLIMTLMIGVAVLVVPQRRAEAQGAPAEHRGAVEQSAPAEHRGPVEPPELAGRLYRIWCDPTFGSYLGESLGAVVSECGGSYTGVSA
jgi:sarcosine oxidase, subunit gamma